MTVSAPERVTAIRVEAGFGFAAVLRFFGFFFGLTWTKPPDP